MPDGFKPEQHMPEPESPTEKTTSLPARCAPTRTIPPGRVNLIALPTKFENTCSTRSLSAKTDGRMSLDGVFVEEGSPLAAPPPTRGELLAIAVRMVARVTRWLKKHGYLRGETDSNEAPALSFEETLAKAAMSRGTMTTLREDDGEPDASEEATRPATTEAVVHQGFNLHASVTIAADDDMGRERLCRLCGAPHKRHRRSRAARSPAFTTTPACTLKPETLPHHGLFTTRRWSSSTSLATLPSRRNVPPKSERIAHLRSLFATARHQNRDSRSPPFSTRSSA